LWCSHSDRWPKVRSVERMVVVPGPTTFTLGGPFALPVRVRVFDLPRTHREVVLECELPVALACRVRPAALIHHGHARPEGTSDGKRGSRHPRLRSAKRLPPSELRRPPRSRAGAEVRAGVIGEGGLARGTPGRPRRRRRTGRPASAGGASTGARDLGHATTRVRRSPGVAPDRPGPRTPRAPRAPARAPCAPRAPARAPCAPRAPARAPCAPRAPARAP
jgi:hypothetical protein